MNPRPRVLFVDDDASIRQLVELSLEELDIDLVICSSVAQARQALRQRPARLVITDLMMPVESGFDLLQELAETLDAQQPAQAAVLQRFGVVRDLAAQLSRVNAQQTDLAFWVADDFLRAVALALLGWAWTRIEAASPGDTMASRWTAPARALQHWILPEFEMRQQIIQEQLTPAGAQTLLAA